jgi:hypothetical protein
MLYPPSDKVSAHAGVSVYTLKLCVSIQCRVCFLNEKFCHRILPEKRVLASHFVIMKYDHVTGAVDVIFFLVLDDRCD